LLALRLWKGRSMNNGLPDLEYVMPEGRSTRSRLTASRAAVGDLSVISMFEAQARQHPERVAIRFGAITRTYAELNQRVDRMAAHLRARGVGPGTLVAVLLERSVDLLVSVLGTLKAGGAYVPLDPSHPSSRIALVLEDAKPTLLVTSRALGEKLPDSVQRLFQEDFAINLPELASVAHIDAKLQPEHLAYVIFTSGSTGRPKGVAISHGALANFLVSMQAKPGIKLDDRVLAITTIAFDIAGLELFLPLTVGARIELLDTKTAQDPSELIRAMAERQPTLVQATPATWRMLLEVGWPGDPHIKALCGGEA
jgi:non-ribosomal peptide synthetase component F